MKNMESSKKEKTPKATVRLAIWTLAWVLSLALSNFGPHFLWESKLLSTVFIGFNFLIGFGMIWANIKHINSLDELQRKINVDAIAFSLGVAIVAGLAYSTLDTANVISGDAEISVLVVIISVSQMIALVVGKMRYK
tara:strand:- start:469311 stop:469721 length:411 start_codon:yes stop_codon:yes gene_type:complete